MHTASTDSFQLLMLPDNVGFESLRQLGTLEQHVEESSTLIFWDTFEWGIWFGGYLLYSCGEQYHLARRQGGWLGTAVSEELAEGNRHFWQDFTTGTMRSVLQDMLGLRRLMPVAEGRFRTRRYDLRNELDKIVCRLELRSVSQNEFTEELLLNCCQILPLRGYETTALNVRECLVSYGATPCEQCPYELLLQLTGSMPRSYTLRPAFGLCHETPARDALDCIVRSMLELARENLPGILLDLDTEFLHDYRICLRKIRSLLSLLQDVYPAEEIRRIRNQLGDWARLTNRLRDLDVYLLSREEYLGLLPPVFRPILTTMFEDFATERKQEIERTTAQLRSCEHQQFLDDLADYFSAHAQHEETSSSRLAVGPLVYRAIIRRYRKIRKLAETIQPASPDELLHRIRIECKKLRYLMEFFAELIPDETGALLQKLLRRLQGRLGDFNDASVQQASLLAYWKQSRLDAATALGVGGLVACLYQRQQQSRPLIIQSLDEFCGGAAAKTFKRSFRQPEAVSLTTLPQATQP